MPTSEIVASVESGLRDAKVPPVTADTARTAIIGILQKRNPPPSNITPDESRALRSLRRDYSIVILPADKGRSTVVMDKSDYEKKAMDLLSETNTYRKLPRDPAASLERRMNALLLELKRSGVIPDPLYYRLRSSAGRTPLFYGLPKVHKPNIPLRPIASFVGSPSYQLSKHLVYLLVPLVGKTCSHVKNSIEFASFISDQTLQQDQMLVSFDVVPYSPTFRWTWPVKWLVLVYTLMSPLKTKQCCHRTRSWLSQVLPECYQPGISRELLSTNIRNSHGVSSVSDSSWPGHGRCGGKSPDIFPIQTAILEEVQYGTAESTMLHASFEYLSREYIIIISSRACWYTLRVRIELSRGDYRSREIASRVVHILASRFSFLTS